mgnify:CR=1 FL=1
MKFVEILAPGFEEIEALTPVDYLRRGGVEVTIAGISACGESFSKTIKGAHGINVECDVSFDEYLSALNGELPDGIIIPGGMPGAANIGSDKDVLNFILKMNECGKFICAICAAPIVVLAQTGILAGKQFTCYPGMEQNIAKYVPDPSQIDNLMKGAYLNLEKSNVHDGNIITGKGPGAAEEFSMTILKACCGVDEMMRVKTASVQR